MKLKTYYLSIFIISIQLLIGHNIYSQNYDSLWGVWKNTSLPDTSRLQAMYIISWNGFLFTDPDSAYKLTEIQLQYATQKKLPYYQAQALNTQGVYYYFQGDLNNAEQKYLASLSLREQINDLKGIAGTTNNLGLIYNSKGNNKKAIEFYLKSLKIQEEINNQLGISNALNNIGNIYASLQEHDKAIEYYNKCLEIFESQNNASGIASTNNNIGGMYNDKNDYEKALYHFEIALKLRREIDEKKGIAETLNNIGLVYYNQEKYTLSNEKFHESLHYRKLINDKSGLASTYKNLAHLQIKLHHYREAIKYANIALEYAKETESIIELRDAFEALYLSYNSTKQYELAFKALTSFVNLKDSILNEESKLDIIQTNFQYEQNLKDAADSVKRAEEKKTLEALQKVENTKKDAEIKTTQNYLLIAIIGFVIITFFSAFIFNRLQLISKQKKVIEHQKSEVERQREYAIKQKEIADGQRNVVEEKNQEITDSINYAKRIQDAILPSQKSLIKYLKNGFVLYLPKDVVSGDFYWLENFQNKTFFAAADCTGHGVPGALVSMICSNALSKALLEDGITDPGKLLDKTRELVIQRFSKSDEDVKDGMDISLVVLDQKDNHTIEEPQINLKWSGANNPLWIINPKRKIWPNVMLAFENGAGAEFKPNSQPIGKYESIEPFTTQSISLEKGDTIYSFTDGYQDQFGGEKGKKLKSVALKKMLVAMHHLTMDEQKEKLHQAFYAWKGNLEQIDDICIIGVRI